MRIIPAIDILGGKCVRLTQGDYTQQKIYNENPLEVAKRFEAHGVEYLHLVDLDGARSKHIVNHAILEAITTQTRLKVDFGGGLKSDEDLRIAFACGACQVTGGSIAVKRPEIFALWLEVYGPEKIILGADVRNNKIAVHGWQETVATSIFDLIRTYTKQQLRYVICTDISRDGMLEGPALDLYKTLLTKNKGLQLIASGGVASTADLRALDALGCEGAIVGKALYENKITLKDLEYFV